MRLFPLLDLPFVLFVAIKNVLPPNQILVKLRAGVITRRAVKSRIHTDETLSLANRLIAR
jgi:hypothetical protein